MKVSELAGKKILIAGYGIEGKATMEYLNKFAPTAQVEKADREDGPGYLDNQREYDIVIRSPGIPLDQIHTPHTTATNIFFANLDSRHTTIGVTGSKGKSTTSSLIAHILSVSGKNVRLVGNIGKPMLESLLNPSEDAIIFVIELSSYQLEDCTFSPHISVCTSLFPEHIPHHKTLAQYYAAKQHIVLSAIPEDYFVYNPNFEEFVAWTKSTRAKSIPFGTDIQPPYTPLLGEHNESNVRGAVTVSRLMGISDALAYKAIKTFQPLPHRLQEVGTYKGITFIDDAISTAPESTIAAIHALPNTSCIFLGGEDRGYDFQELARILKKCNITYVVLFPDSGARIKKALEAEGLENWTVCETSSMEEAVQFAYRNTSETSICLLSTASPSYSLWKDYIHKGNEFQEFVKQYGEKN